MAVFIDEENSTNDKKAIIFDNGDWQKANKILKDWDFVDIQTMMRTMMSVFLLTHNKKIGLVNERGEMESFGFPEDLFNNK